MVLVADAVAVADADAVAVAVAAKTQKQSPLQSPTLLPRWRPSSRSIQCQLKTVSAVADPVAKVETEFEVDSVPIGEDVDVADAVADAREVCMLCVQSSERSVHIMRAGQRSIVLRMFVTRKESDTY